MFHAKRDLDADALYVRLADASVAETVEIDPGTMVDLTADGAVVGIEVIRPNRQWPLREILDRFPVPAHERDLLLAMYGRRGSGALDAPEPSLFARAG